MKKLGGDIPISSTDNKRLFELDIPEDAVLAAIFRDDKLIIPRGNAQIMSGDKVLVIAKDRVLHELSTALKLTR